MVTVECVLAIDLGTGGPKVAVVAPDGGVVAWSSRPVATRFIGDHGAEQDPEEMWSAVVAATHDTIDRLAGVGAVPVSFAAVAVTSQYMSVVPVAADGRPTGPCILWMDTRGAAHNRQLLNGMANESTALFLERHGLIPLPGGSDNVAHIAALREHHPDAYAAAVAFVEPMDYLAARLTGTVGATQSTMFGQLVCDNRTWGATTYDPELVAATRLDPDKLPALRPMNGFVGELRSDVAAELGVVAGIPVAVPTIDSITSAIGTGAIDATRGSVVIGTTSVVVSHVGEHRCDIRSGVLGVPSPLPGQYFVMAENGVGGRALEWAATLFGHPDGLTGALLAAESSSVGANGVGFMPWLLGSIAPRPDGNVRAAFTGLALHHRRDDVYRAVLEGVALNLAWLVPAVERFVGNPFAFVGFGGGAAQSDLWAQILADALDRPVHQFADPRTANAVGAALLAFADLGRLSIADVPTRLRVHRVYEPREQFRAVMDNALGRLIELHGTLRAR